MMHVSIHISNINSDPDRGGRPIVGCSIAFVPPQSEDWPAVEERFPSRTIHVDNDTLLHFVDSIVRSMAAL